MAARRTLWLVNNIASGSNDDEALVALEHCCGTNGFHVAHRTVFPDQDLPTPAILEAAEVDHVAVFAGDGTVNSLIAALAGWGGSVLVLAGGTMNLLYHRLHGQRTLQEVVEAAASGRSVLCRPGVIRCGYGDAYAGLLAGPGTSWGQVREAMREQDILELAGSAVEAIEETIGGEQIACIAPRLGRKEGYPLLSLIPHDDGIELEAYHAETAGEYLQQSWALLRRNFREGPHEVLGYAPKLTLASTQGNSFGLLIDGEAVEAASEVEFALATAEVDLVATELDE